MFIRMHSLYSTVVGLYFNPPPHGVGAGPDISLLSRHPQPCQTVYQVFHDAVARLIQYGVLYVAEVSPLPRGSSVSRWSRDPHTINIILFCNLFYIAEYLCEVLGQHGIHRWGDRILKWGKRCCSILPPCVRNRQVTQRVFFHCSICVMELAYPHMKRVTK